MLLTAEWNKALEFYEGSFGNSIIKCIIYKSLSFQADLHPLKNNSIKLEKGLCSTEALCLPKVYENFLPAFCLLRGFGGALDAVRCAKRAQIKMELKGCLF